MENDSIAVFDTLYTNNQIQIMKLALPLMPVKNQHMFAVMIKFMELKYTMSLAGSAAYYRELSQKNQHPPYDTGTLLSAMAGYCSKEQAAQLNQIGNMMQMMKTFKELQPVMEMFSAMNSGNSTESGAETGSTGSSLMNPEMLSMLSSMMGNPDNSADMPDIGNLMNRMLTPEQLDLFHAFMNDGNHNNTFMNDNNHDNIFMNDNNHHRHNNHNNKED